MSDDAKQVEKDAKHVAKDIKKFMAILKRREHVFKKLATKKLSLEEKLYHSLDKPDKAKEVAQELIELIGPDKSIDEHGVAKHEFKKDEFDTLRFRLMKVKGALLFLENHKNQIRHFIHELNSDESTKGQMRLFLTARDVLEDDEQLISRTLEIYDISDKVLEEESIALKRGNYQEYFEVRKRSEEHLKHLIQKANDRFKSIAEWSRDFASTQIARNKGFEKAGEALSFVLKLTGGMTGVFGVFVAALCGLIAIVMIPTMAPQLNLATEWSDIGEMAMNALTALSWAGAGLAVGAVGVYGDKILRMFDTHRKEIITAIK